MWSVRSEFQGPHPVQGGRRGGAGAALLCYRHSSVPIHPQDGNERVSAMGSGHLASHPSAPHARAVPWRPGLGRGPGSGSGPSAGSGTLWRLHDHQKPPSRNRNEHLGIFFHVLKLSFFFLLQKQHSHTFREGARAASRRTQVYSEKVVGAIWCPTQTGPLRAEPADGGQLLPIQVRKQPLSRAGRWENPLPC